MAPKAASKKSELEDPFTFHKLQERCTLQPLLVGSKWDYASGTKLLRSRLQTSLRSCIVQVYTDSMLYSANWRQAQCQSQPGRKICPQRRTLPRPSSSPLHLIPISPGPLKEDPQSPPHNLLPPAQDTPTLPFTQIPAQVRPARGSPGSP